MFLNYSWNLLGFFNPIMLSFLISITMIIEYLILNYYLKSIYYSFLLTVIGNLGSFFVGLPLINIQYLTQFYNYWFLSVNFSFFHDLIVHFSNLFTFNITPLFILDFFIFNGLLFTSSYLEFVIIKIFIRKDMVFNLNMSFRVNFVSHMFLLGIFFVIGFLDSISILSLETFFIEADIVSRGTDLFIFFFPYLLILSLIGIFGLSQQIYYYQGRSKSNEDLKD